MTDEDSEEQYGPESPVWSHLWSGIDLAEMEFDAVDSDWAKRAKKMAALVVGARRSLAQPADSLEGMILEFDSDWLSDAWIRHAAEIEVAGDAIERAATALDRYLRLRPMITTRSVPPRAVEYMSEVISTFAFGFDAACIALCRATFEQVTKDSLVRIGEYSDARLKREQPTAGALLAVAKRTGLIVRSATAAEHLVKKGDTVMHKFIYDGRVREQQARDSIAQLAEVLVELLGDGSQASRPAT